MIKIKLLFTAVFFTIFLISNSQNISTLEVAGVKNPVVLLNGTWDFMLNPMGEFWNPKTTKQSWSPIQVPGECTMQGYAIEHDKPFAYRKKFQCPADFSGKKIILRFDGVYSYARLWVNGQYIRDHNGGFTRWECDLTGIVKPGKINTIFLEVTDRADDVSFGSGYAHHHIGGILRDVTLYALPINHIETLHIETHLDENYENASLLISGTAEVQKEAVVQLSLVSPDGKNIPLEVNQLQIKPGEIDFSYSSEIANPLKWDAEHPDLYTLTTTILEKGKKTYSFQNKVGFREVKVEGNKLLVNGKVVKLRGANRHDIHPMLGRVSTDDYSKMDVQLAKEANMNFIRTSHYPPTEKFLDLCNEYGIYVECENAMCFVETTRRALFRKGISTDDPNDLHQYLIPVKAMVNTFRNHPSVIIWSLGNESLFGSNIQKSYQWVKENDPTRPVIFGYPGTVPDSIRSYDILSMHYPDVTGKRVDQRGMTVFDYDYSKMPVIFDEWAHVPSYLQTNKYPDGPLVRCNTLLEDLNEREYWGRTLDMMWQGVFRAQGGLGGAIWGMIDETFMLPDTLSSFGKYWGEAYSSTGGDNPCRGYGEWGIIDTWRRKKPEFWNTKKAYSPVKVLHTTIRNFLAGEDLRIPVHNRFDHTNLSEIKIKYSYKNQERTIGGSEIAPHEKAFITIPAEEWQDGDQLLVQFLTQENQLIDEELITIGYKNPMALKEKGTSLSPLSLAETNTHFIVSNDQLNIPINKKTGLLDKVRKNGEIIIESGPFINLNLGEYSTPGITGWELTEILSSSEQQQIGITSVGNFEGQKIHLHYTIDPSGEIMIYYVVFPERKGWIFEAGLCFALPESFDQLEWERDAYWTSYPANHLGSPSGKVRLFDTAGNLVYREKPPTEWSFDNYSFKYHGIQTDLSQPRLSNIARSMKENIRSYKLSAGNTLRNLEVFSPQADLACRLKHDNNMLLLFISNNWDYPGQKFNNFAKDMELEPFTGKMKLRL